MDTEIPNQKHIRKLIRKALKGIISVEEKKILDAWYDEQEKRRAIAFTHVDKEQFQDQLFQKTLERIDNTAGRKNVRLWKTMGFAASIILLIGIGLFLKPFAEETSPVGAPVPQFERFNNKKGEKRKITLPDGSSIHLSHNSSIKINKNFSKERTVELLGEAFFEVAKKDSLPFVIETPNLTTTVLGTSFNISAQEDASEVVAVRSGKVRVESRGKGEVVYLIERQQTFFADGELKVKAITDPENIFGWTDGKLVFNNTPLSEIGSILEEWYGVEVEISGNISHACQLTGTYRELSLEELMEIIQYSIPIAYEIDGKRLNIISKNC